LDKKIIPYSQACQAEILSFHETSYPTAKRSKINVYI